MWIITEESLFNKFVIRNILRRISYWRVSKVVLQRKNVQHFFTTEQKTVKT